VSRFRFEKLSVWQKSIEFADDVYEVTARFPTDERFGLTNQMRRAAVSISSNIAEGTSRSSNKDYGRFVEIAYGSLMELVSQSHVSRRRDFLTVGDFDRLCAKADELARMLSGLKASLEAR
jgi:four helix bundle protein